MKLSRYSRGRELLNEPAEQAEEFSPGWGERSERKPGYPAKINYQARFRGRQRAVLLCLILALALSGCCRPIDTSPSPPVSSSPREISSSRQVVKLSSSPVSIPANGSAEAVVTLSISPGYHINANPASFPYLIATELQPGKLDGINFAKPLYPSAIRQKFQFAEEPLAVYEGEAVIRLPLRAAASISKGQHSLPFKLRVQACDDEKCFAPDTLDGSVPVTVN